MDRLVRLLLSKGASVNVLSREGTPLHVAASYGKSGIMQILLQHNADVISNLIYSSGGALLHICVTIFLLRFK
jgi:ankyrin repeat protein